MTQLNFGLLLVFSTRVQNIRQIYRLPSRLYRNTFVLGEINLNMMRAIKISIIVCAASLGVAAQALPVKVENHLKKNYPGWQVGESLQVAAKSRRAIEQGDFNGDGKTDYAVLITKDDRLYALALIAAKNTFKAYNLIAQNKENPWIAGIEIAPKGSLIEYEEPITPGKSFALKTDGIKLYDNERRSTVFYWQNGRFVSSVGS